MVLGRMERCMDLTRWAIGAIGWKGVIEPLLEEQFFEAPTCRRQNRESIDGTVWNSGQRDASIPKPMPPA